jgi:NADPH:quinone reductase-like Zn-dependent oxidoreductase
MKAIVYTEYGSPDKLRLEEVAKPTPTDDQVLIKVVAASVNRSDWEGLVGSPLYARLGGLFKPGFGILGSDVAGVVEAVGKNITRFKPGDAVFGLLPTYKGGFAEYVVTSGKAFALKPAGMRFEDATTIPHSGAIAMQGIVTKGQVQAGQQVLINGAGGGAGAFAVQLAKLHSAEVTGVDNTEKLAYIRSLGADYAIDYTREDFTKNGKQYDLILDVIAHRSVFDYARALKPNGTYYAVGGPVRVLFQILFLGSWMGRNTGKKIRVLAVETHVQELLDLAALYESGKLVSIIDRTYPLSEVPEALRYLGEGHAKGKIVITMEANSNT